VGAGGRDPEVEERNAWGGHDLEREEVRGSGGDPKAEDLYEWEADKNGGHDINFFYQVAGFTECE
jgi:hypothetical protein